MENINRRSFCGASLLALPVMRAFAKEKGMDDLLSQSDPVMDALADEFSRTTLSGTRTGFSAEHFRQYAGQMRMLNALLDAKGTNKKLNMKLDDDDYYLMNPDRTLQIALEYWEKRGVLLNEDKLRDLLDMDENTYFRLKKAIKKHGGFQKLHESMAEAFERSAERYASTVFKSGLTIRGGSIEFPAFHGPARGTNFMNVQLDPTIDPIGSIDPHLFLGVDLDCLCKAMTLEGAGLTVLCVTICPPCCVPAAILLAFATMGKNLGFCDPDQC